MRYKQFYAELGKLLYAVADIDGVISVKEKKKLLDLVKIELAASEKNKDEFGSNLAFYTETEFDFLDENIADANAAFESFIDFVEEHHTAFDVKMKKLSLHVANELAAAYYGTSIKEKVLLEKLKLRLKKIKVKSGPEKKIRNPVLK